MASIPELDLGDYKFNFIGYWIQKVNQDQLGYEFFELQSVNKQTGEITDFGVYGSKSELGILRLGSLRSGSGQFEKGKQYIVSSFIHPKIIQWIYENKSKIEPKQVILGREDV